ncbi:HAD family hydrolase [Octadecabacter sp. CECT 8868]|uniref:HAD family hydrolase n=1 Tax=Octadecabacter algicola TaxID=2909342 RepID=UPI001F339BEE|nr:HAD family hydrolase [Octadecabacter algicola]MCF2904584.1 HAD family hydrolase [Octadecabacter algicola]
MTEKAIKGVIFDKDGTLFDFNATWGAWARGMLAAETANAPEMLAPLAQALGYDLDAGLFKPQSIVIAGTIEDVALAALPYLPDSETAPIIARFNAATMDVPQVEAAPLVPFLDRLKTASLKLGVATNDAEEPARAHLDVAGATRFFDFIAGFDSGFGGKPAAGQLHAFCATTGLSPDVCAMVGDSTHDLHAGRAAGMTTVAVLTGVAGHDELAPHADVVLGSIAELPAWLGL